MNNEINPNIQTKFDLEERTAKFGEAVIKFCQEIIKDDITRPLLNQLLKSATSVGANYCEADDAESKKDFKHKIGICKKEAREAKHFLRMFIVALPDRRSRIDILWNEAKELNLIFNAIYKKV